MCHRKVKRLESLFPCGEPINLEGPDRKVAFNWVTLYYTAALEKGEKKGGKSLPTNELSFGSIAEPFRQNHGRENGDSGTHYSESLFFTLP